MAHYITTTSFTQVLEQALQAKDISIQADFRLRTPDVALAALLRDAYRNNNNSIPIHSLLDALNVAHIGILLNEVSMAEGSDAASRLATLISYGQEIGVLLSEGPRKVTRTFLSLQAKQRIVVLFGIFIVIGATGQSLYIVQTGEFKLTDITPFVYFLTASLSCWNWIVQNHKD